MVSNKNIFAATNPAHILDALWKIISASNVPLENTIIFLPSRRAVRSVEQMLVHQYGHAIILPHLVALGEGVDDTDEYEPTQPDTISNIERVVILAKLLSMDAHIGNISTALPIAHDLVRMTDYLENEGQNIANINWTKLIDEKYAEHFRGKAKILKILSDNISSITQGRITTTTKRNADIRAWIPFLTNPNCKYKSVIVCGSTASVPATADLMATIAELPFGKIILSGKIAGRDIDFELPTNPYYSEHRFLSRIGCALSDIQLIDVGPSDTIDFMNAAFGNDPTKPDNLDAVSHCHLIECDRESVEALAVAEITARAIHDNKSVLVITPDAAGNQRIASAFVANNIVADFSGGQPATMHPVGRAILNLFDDWIEKKSHVFEDLYADANHDLFKMIVKLVDSYRDMWTPRFNPMDEANLPIWIAIRDMSNALMNNGIILTINDARAFISDVLSTVIIRGTPANDVHTCVLGTIESRMQTADVVILTGLNDGMFPARGYENSWLPRNISEQIGLPPPDRKVSLMSLDFMNLSCCGEVYWLRSKMSGGAQTPESRFISRVTARGGKFDKSIGNDILSTIHARDDIELRPLDYSAPTPPADWSDVYVTELELLIHNPYAFYARHILRLHPIDDYWLPPDARIFGTMVHDTIEYAQPGDTPDTLVARMDAAAHDLLGTNSVLFHFWHKRFMEIAPLIANEINTTQNAYAEIPGAIKIANRTVRARADRVYDGVVMDIKTGAAPSKSQLMDGNMPQLPLEAFMLQSDGFKIPTTVRSKTPIMVFLQLRNNDVARIEYDSETTQQMIDAAIQKTTELFNMYSAGSAPYEYHETGDIKYKAYDDLARINDL